MSDKIYLKEITLPIVETGENETYSFVQTDADLETAGDAADAKAVGDELTNLKQDLDGLDVYTLGLYPQMSVADTAVASFTDGADNIPVKSLKVDITPVQSGSGDPSPENVRPISGWTGANVFRSSKNLFDVHDKNTNSQSISKEYHLRLKPNTQYTCSSNCPQGNPANLYFGGGSTDSNGVYDGHPQTMTSDANGRIVLYVRYAVPGSSQGAINMYQALLNGTYWVQVEEGSTATEYEPVTRYNVDWTTSAGTVYGGTLDVTNGVLTVDHVKKELTGAETSWSQYDVSSPYNYYMVSLGYNRNTCVTGSGICTHFPAATINSSNDSLGFRCADSSSLNKFGAFFRWDMSGDFDTLEKFKTYVAEQYSNNTPIEVCFKVNSGETYQLTPTEVSTLLGQNNIFADTGNINELTYRADLKAYIDAHVGS